MQQSKASRCADRNFYRIIDLKSFNNITTEGHYPLFYLFHHNCLAFWQQFALRIDAAPTLKAQITKPLTSTPLFFVRMKLWPRNKPPTNDSSTNPATVPVSPPDITRLQTPPISELSNAGSTTVRKERLSDSSSSVVDDSDMQERMESLSPATNRRRLKITVPPAAATPLTKNNLEKLSEEITSAVEINGSEGFFSTPMPSPHTRLVQARNFLLAENRNTCLGFATMLEQIDDFLREIPGNVRRADDSIYHEVKDLLRTHKVHIRTGEQVPSPPVTPKRTSRPPQQDVDNDSDNNKDPNDQAADPFEWTNKINTLIDGIRRDPSAQRPSVVMSQLRDLARPLNKGRLPSADEARRLITERIGMEGGWGRNDNVRETKQTGMDDGDIEDVWSGFDDDEFPPADEETENEEEEESSMENDDDDDDGWAAGANGKAEPVNVKRMQLGRGSMMPKEVREWDWERDRGVVLGHDYDDDEYGEDEEEEVEGEGEGQGQGAQLLLAETPFLQMLMGEQIRGDLESGEFVVVFFGGSGR